MTDFGDGDSMTQQKRVKSKQAAKPSRNGKKKSRGKVQYVVIRTIESPNGLVKIPIDDKLMEEADYWARRLDSRSRLNEVDRKRMRVDALKRLEEHLGIYSNELEEMAHCGIVQISMPFNKSDLAAIDPSKAQESSIEPALKMPWEYVLSAATKQFRRYPLYVVRHIDGNNEAMVGKKAPKSFSFIETAPGEFKSYYDFTSERALVEGAFSKLDPVDVAISPTIDEIGMAFSEYSPRVVHVSGIDSRLGDQLRQEAKAKEELLKPAPKDDSTGSRKPGAGRPVPNPDPKPVFAGGAALMKRDAPGAASAAAAREGAMDPTMPSEAVVDGMYFTENNEASKINFRVIADALTSGREKPQLIGFNCQYSGVRMAPWTVARGVREAIGIQDTLDDEIAERFFIRFYQQWLEWDQDSLAAFIAAWEFIKPLGESVKGTGIILWLNADLFPRKSKAKSIEPSVEGIKEVHRRLKIDKKDHNRHEKVANPCEHKVEELVQVKVQPPKLITPCMLHYGKSVLQRLEFIFRNLDPSEELPVECIDGIDVEVTLKVGSELYPYRTRVSVGLNHPKIELANDNLVATDENPAGGIKVPLTSNIIQSSNENIRASIFVDIQWHGQTLKKHTYSVEIAPVNEWRLNEKDSLLQPMFMQPRDPAVKDIVIAAQKYLACIEGNAKWGFRGYQADDIEPQMNAIWQALLYDFKLDYVSPPPSYNEGAQRLRTPSQVLREKRGTCIDLAMLYASCLEWIELYPVIFNTTKHTFVGCWRYDSTPEESIPRNPETGEEILSYNKFFENHKKGAYAKGMSSADNYPWVIKPNEFGILNDLVFESAIIPLETVCLTEYKLYEYGRKYAIDYFMKEETIDQGLDSEESVLVRSSELEPSTLDGFYPGKFESFIDVRSSRKFLQPLPLEHRCR